jgi:plasmid stabilization system protein ParE
VPSSAWSAFLCSAALAKELARGLRSLLCREHVIFYRVHAERIEIIRVMHQRRDASAAFSKPD